MMLTRILGLSAIAALGIGLAAAANADPNGAPGSTKTRTPVNHVIVLIGENHSFDNVFATYRPEYGRHVSNLLAKGIIEPDGSPGPNAAEASQFQIDAPLPSTYFIGTAARSCIPISITSRCSNSSNGTGA
jgi:phospholipase C